MRRLDHEISGHLHDVGAPIELLYLIFEKIAAGVGVAIGLQITPAWITRYWRIAPPEFPSRMLGAQPPRRLHSEAMASSYPISRWLPTRFP